VRRISDGKIYALKKIEITKFNLKEKDNALNEISILEKCRHPNIIKFHEAFMSDDNLSLWYISLSPSHY
jgi:NIMA (never in mitosis gene a)-related kinase